MADGYLNNNRVDYHGLADLFGLSVATVKRRMPIWQQSGFPDPLPWSLRSKHWSRPAVERWKHRQEIAAGADTPHLVHGGRAA